MFETSFRRATLAAAVLLTLASGAIAQDRTFKVGADVGFAPHVMAKPDGGTEGFNVDLIEAVAARMKAKVEIVNIPIPASSPPSMPARSTSSSRRPPPIPTSPASRW